MNKDTSARCKDCGISQRERQNICVDGSRYHNFVRTGIATVNSEIASLNDFRQSPKVDRWGLTQ